MDIKKKNLLELYGIPEEVLFCRRCTMSNQRPRITFDSDGTCSACNFSDHKKNNIDWTERHNELEKLCNKFRKDDGSYDIIIPCSGGKDGSYVAHMMKYKYNMNPLCVTWAPHIYTEIGKKNLDNFINIGDFDHILGTRAGQVHRKLSKFCFNYAGDAFLPFIYGQTNFPNKIAINYNISLIMYGENGEVEYGGDNKNWDKPQRTISDQDLHYFHGKPVSFWEDKGFSRKDLAPYMPPKFEDIKRHNLEVHFFSYYHFWDPQENFYYAVENTGFDPNPERTEGTFTKYASLDDKTDWLHYYLAFIKFGIGRATYDSAHEIRDEKITREEGVALVKKYDDEFPKRYFIETLQYLDINEDEFWEVIDSWRSPHIWKKENNQWTLKNKIWP